MDLTVWVSDKLKRPKHEVDVLKQFIQEMCNRLGFGFVRYGCARSEQRYMTRMTMELKAYKRYGNREHLLNIANYCYLESLAPENKKFHFDNNAESVTRGKI